MNTLFDYKRARAYLRSGSRSDLLAGPATLSCALKNRGWFLVRMSVLILCLMMTVFLAGMLTRDPLQINKLLSSESEKSCPESVAVCAEPLSVDAVESAADSDACPQEEEPSALVSRDIVVKRGDTLLDLLVREGLARDDAHGVVGALRQVFNPRRLRHGQALTITYESPEPESFAFKSLHLKLDPAREVMVDRCAAAGFSACEVVREFETRTLRADFEISSSLYQAAARHNVPFEMLLPVINAYAYDVDFQRDIQPGDYFEIMYDVQVDSDGTVACMGTTTYAALTTRGQRLTLYYYQDSDGAFDYFDAQGRSLKKNLMVTPVDGARISSRYGMRRHPVLGYSRMHRGLDFAAPTGTPIKAAGDGVIEVAGRQGNYGNMVRLRHANNYQTLYAHMSRFGRNIRPGVRVTQGQIIGYVGSTGMSTGPHLHYEVLHHGRHINPASIKSTPSRILDGTERARFMEARSELEVRFASLKEPAVFAGVQRPEA
jgi:murein DD-endopeptidase MepM/ murein hydrolase activator NlpD